MLTLILLLLLVLVGFPAAVFGIDLWLERRYDRRASCEPRSVTRRKAARRS